MAANTPGFNPTALLGALAGLFSNTGAGGTGAGLGTFGANVQQPIGSLSALLGGIGATPRAIPGVATRTTQGASPFPGYLSPQQQLQLAKQEALAQLQPILDEYHYQQDQARQYAQAQADVARARGEALANIDAGIGPQIQQAYKQAADSTAGYAKGYSTNLQNAANADAAANNTELDKVSPGIGQRQTAPNLSDVLFGSMGVIPANALQTTGTAFASAADMLPATARGQGEQDATTALNQGYLTNQDLLHQIGSFLKQTPALTQSALSDLQKQQLGLYNANQTARARADQANRADKNTALTGARLLSNQTRTVYNIRPTADGGWEPYQLLQNGKPIQTGAGQDAAARLVQQRDSLGFKVAANLSQTGDNYVYDPATGKVALNGRTAAGQRLDLTQNQVKINNALAAGWVQNPSTGKWELSLQARKTIAGLNGGIDPVTGKKIASQVNADRSYALARKQYLLSLNASQRADLKRLEADSPYVWQYDNAGNPQVVTDPATGKPLLSNNGRRLAQSDRRLNDSETAQAWTRQQADAAAKTQSGLIFHVVSDKRGNPVVEPWIVNGKPMLTAALRKQLQGRPPSYRDKISQDAHAKQGARLAFQGGVVDERAPANGFVISKTDPGNGQGWAEPLIGADNKLIGYRNHYPPVDLATAFQDAVEHGIDPQVATRELLKLYTGHPDRGGPMSKGQRQNAKRLPGQLKRAGIKPSQYVPPSQLPRAEPGR